MFAELCLFIIIILLVIHYRIENGIIGRLLKEFPGPKTFPLIGCTHKFIFCKDRNIYKVIDKLNEEYYPTFRIWAMTWSTVHIQDVDDAEIFLTNTKNITKSDFYSPLSPWLKEGLLLSTGTKWHNRRKILTPAFHFQVLSKYMEVLLSHGDKMVKTLKSPRYEKSEFVIDLIPFAMQHTLSIICETAMGVSLDVMSQEMVQKYREAIISMGEITIYRLLRPLFMFDFLYYNFSTKARKEKEDLRILHEFSSKIINERKEYHRKTDGKFLQVFAADEVNKSEEENIYIGIKRKRLAMLDLLIAASRDDFIDDAGIQEEIDTFIFEGHDTSAKGLAFMIQLLSEHTEIQEKAREEVCGMWKACEGNISITEINRLPYLDRCMREALRLYPPVPFVSRKITEDLTLKSGTVPSGVMTHLFIYEIHRDPKVWPDPLKFDPDRFLPERSVGRHPFAYLPFSAGPRNCIGQRLAMLELKTLTAFILYHFNLEAITLHKDFERHPDLTLRPSTKLEVKFIGRDEK